MASLLIDSHVHFHECFTWQAFLDAAVRNFARAQQQLETRAASGCLMFTESAGVNHFRALLQPRGPASALGWEVEKGDDGCSIVLGCGAGEALVIVAGRQVVTAERLEVLALGCAHEFVDGRPIHDVLSAVADREAFSVIPWGVGKWWGRRGRIVRGLLESPPAPFCLGDNGGRASRLSRPALFQRAERLAVPVLAGSDPLPLAHHAIRAGSYGFVLDGWEPTATPATAITARLRRLRHSPPVFGRLSSFSGMIRSQVGIRRQARTRAGRG